LFGRPQEPKGSNSKQTALRKQDPLAFCKRLLLVLTHQRGIRDLKERSIPFERVQVRYNFSNSYIMNSKRPYTFLIAPLRSSQFERNKSTKECK
jgi:hypothetical protein